MTGFLPVWAQAVAAIVGIIGGLGFLFKILRKVNKIVEIVPVVTLIAEEFEIAPDPEKPGALNKRDPRRVLPVLIEIAEEFKPNDGETLHDRIEHIEKALEKMTNDRT